MITTRHARSQRIAIEKVSSRFLGRTSLPDMPPFNRKLSRNFEALGSSMAAALTIFRNLKQWNRRNVPG
jgi:hypothetical protein